MLWRMFRRSGCRFAAKSMRHVGPIPTVGPDKASRGRRGALVGWCRKKTSEQADIEVIEVVVMKDYRISWLDRCGRRLAALPPVLIMLPFLLSAARASAEETCWQPGMARNIGIAEQGCDAWVIARPLHDFRTGAERRSVRWRHAKSSADPQKPHDH